MTASARSLIDTRTAARIEIRGLVQGIGVRPAVARLAGSLHLDGHVANQTGGVEIHVEGPAADVAQFEESLPQWLPEAALVNEIVSSPVPMRQCLGFRIETGGTGGRLATPVPRDLAVCKRCQKDVECGSDRRRGYVFTSCSDCGPRYSILSTMPYERARTSMQEFPLCEFCAAEFCSPADRRFHAQTNACPACGPSLWIGARRARPVLPSDAAIAAAVHVLRIGGLIAIKGIGGYQLLCDATCRQAVLRLRTAKQRPFKPLAVMLGDGELTSLVERERDAFESPANPIVVVSREVAPQLVREISPGLDTVGMMRPTSPLHTALLSATARPLVVTSGNTDGRPLHFEEAAAEGDLGPQADLLLHHDRRIVRPVDDSVVRVIADRAVTIRCGRGLAPLPLALPEGEPTLAVGGHQKVAVALCNGVQSVLGPHIGDQDTVPLRERFATQVRELLQLYGAEPQLIVHDSHPDYFTTRWAQEQNLPTLAVQHHHAHVVAGMIEHNWLDRQVLGVAFDGTGWGPDGTIWGGEFLLTTAADYERVCSVLPFPLPGGETAVRQPWRTALALLSLACGVESAAAVLARVVSPERLRSMLPLLGGQNAPQTSSIGRLFDAVAALILRISDSSYEGEPAMRLESACDPTAQGEYPLPICRTATGPRLDWRPLLRSLCEDLNVGETPGAMAMRFHRALSTAVSQVAANCSNVPVVLGGGCFQNRRLTELLVDRLWSASREVGPPGTIPPNDGGLAAGQLAIAQARWRHSPAASEPEVVSCV